MHITFSCSFSYSLSENVEYSSLCYTVGPCCLSILYVTACICQSQAPNPSLLHPLATTGLFSMSVSLFLPIGKLICVVFQISHINDIMWHLSDFTCENLQVRPCCCRWHYCVLFMAEWCSTVYLCTLCVCLHTHTYTHGPPWLRVYKVQQSLFRYLFWTRNDGWLYQSDGKKRSGLMCKAFKRQTQYGSNYWIGRGGMRE